MHKLEKEEKEQLYIDICEEFEYSGYPQINFSMFEVILNKIEDFQD